MSDPKQEEYVIGGVKVQFPVKPYPSQIAMMAQIMKGLRRRQNCLLESPTGSGKSLALLCSTLAWQEAEADRVQRYNSLLDQNIRDPDILARVLGEPPPRHGGFEPPPATIVPPTDPQQNPVGNVTLGDVEMLKPEEAVIKTDLEGGFLRADDDDDDDFRMKPVQVLQPHPDVTLDSSSLVIDDDSVLQNDDLPFLPRLERMRVPKIFFGTRTHKQLSQIIRELRKTKYNNVKSVVLGSREHTCIHPMVSSSDNKNEECRKIRDQPSGSQCSYDHGVQRMRTFDQLSSFGLDSVWDLEDLVKVGRKVRACPYYSTRHLMDEAQIIFCPYNYVTDPMIRDSMSIDLHRHVLILDEAHNIEDSAREAASFSFTQTNILDAKNELEKLSSYEVHPASCNSLAKMLSCLSMWMDSYSDKLADYVEFNRTSKIFSGYEAAKEFDKIDLDVGHLAIHQFHLKDLTEEPDPESSAPRPSAFLTMLLKGFFQTLEFLYRNGKAYCQDYKLALLKTQVFGPRRAQKSASGWVSQRQSTNNEEFSLNLWCLNPGVSFSDIGKLTRSIILTSGTLSPMGSFQSELGVEFPIQLEANHVIKKDQVWIGTISQGPTEMPLLANFRNTETYGFQDELGRLVLEVCKVVPRGILCFFPSYSLLDKLIDRWQNTDIWNDILNVKVIVTETKKSSQFDTVMRIFYDTLESTRNAKPGEVNGALFLAVCRGKVSEGLDFSDDNARAVIAVGIPFPNIKDIKVDLKRKFNTQYSTERSLLTGSEWYEVQAYRALNQALGRCIRHRYDWGVLILVDERYQQPSWKPTQPGQNKYTQGLSKWVRNSLQHHQRFSSAINSIELFADRMTKDPPGSGEILEAKSTCTEDRSLKFATPPPPPIASIFKMETSSNLNSTVLFGKTTELDNSQIPTSLKPPLTSTQYQDISNSKCTIVDEIKIERKLTDIQNLSHKIHDISPIKKRRRVSSASTVAQQNFRKCTELIDQLKIDMNKEDTFELNANKNSFDSSEKIKNTVQNYSHSHCLANKAQQNTLTVSKANQSNTECISDDDLFGDTDIIEFSNIPVPTQVVKDDPIFPTSDRSSLNRVEAQSQKSGNLKKRTSSSKLNKSRLSKHNSSGQHFDDSDIDDFNLNVSSVKRKSSKGHNSRMKKLGVNFTDYGDDST